MPFLFYSAGNVSELFFLLGPLHRGFNGQLVRRPKKDTKEEKKRIIDAAIIILQEEIRAQVYYCLTYPSYEEISKGGKNQIGEMLTHLLSGLMKPVKGSPCKQKVCTSQDYVAAAGEQFIVYLYGDLANVKSGLEQRIIGGSTAKISNFPFYVSIRAYPNNYLCGGAIIDRYWVVTAAQCVYSKYPNNILVVAGTDALNGTGDRYGVYSIHINPFFNSITKTNDTALLKLTRKLTYGKNISSIALAKDVLSDGKTLELCGFGAFAYPFRSMSSHLNSIEIKSISNAQCSAALNRQIHKSNLCTKGKSAKGACVGDVGSPLISRGGFFEKTKLYGIVSWDSSCGQGRPDVYSSIAAARPWITAITGL
ncbi:hypothetical protein RI129_013066 [Pyrocoelia pectoralis]|uniref:Peptidase S1 domain-containing protein n=1 Tax=Pyrocoelia pectoralis TaxID=417401 RepID=A0AAN7V466_9COLE